MLLYNLETNISKQLYLVIATLPENQRMDKKLEDILLNNNRKVIIFVQVIHKAHYLNRAIS